MKKHFKMYMSCSEYAYSACSELNLLLHKTKSIVNFTIFKLL